jgi:hypothetical protein
MKHATKAFFPVAYPSIDFLVYPENISRDKSLFSSIDNTIELFLL